MATTGAQPPYHWSTHILTRTPISLHPFHSNPLQTRHDLRVALLSLLDPILPHFNHPSCSFALVQPSQGQGGGSSATHYDRKAAGLEGFARPLWGLASYLSGLDIENGETPESISPIDNHQVWQAGKIKCWTKGFRNGPDPNSDEEDRNAFWGIVGDKDQRMVEMAPLGYALAVAPKWFWATDTLPDKSREMLAEWLGSINGKDMPDTNWLWFRVFANLSLSHLYNLSQNSSSSSPSSRSFPSPPQSTFSTTQLNTDLTRLDQFYLSNGFSNDGPDIGKGPVVAITKEVVFVDGIDGKERVEREREIRGGTRQIDYYSGSFAIQFEGLVYSKLRGEADPERAERYRERARQYAKSFVHWFDEDGRAITFGRSLIYRFAMAAFWGALAYADVTPPLPLTWGHVKGLLLRHFRWWSKYCKEMLNSDGTLSVGYTYPNTYMAENYNSPGSPYWAFKSFIVLSLPPTHPFWTSQELPLSTLFNPPNPTNDLSLNPHLLLPNTLSLLEPLQIVTRSQGTHTFILSSGQMCHYPVRHSSSKYGKFSYSSAFGYSIPTGLLGLEQRGGESEMCLCDAELGEDGVGEWEGGVGGGEAWRSRRKVERARIQGVGGFGNGNENDDDGGYLVSLWKPWKNVEVKTFLIPPNHPHFLSSSSSTSSSSNKNISSAWHVRVHRIRIDKRYRGGRRIKIAEGGWAGYAMGSDGRHLPTFEFGTETGAGAGVKPKVGNGVIEGKWEGLGESLVKSESGVVGIRGMVIDGFGNGKPSKIEGRVISADANSNIIHGRSVIPTLLLEFGSPSSPNPNPTISDSAKSSIESHDGVTAASEEEKGLELGGIQEAWFVVGVFGIPTRAGEKDVTKGKDWWKEWEEEGPELEQVLKMVRERDSID